MGVGGWGFGVWGWGFGPKPPIPNPQSPIPNPHLFEIKKNFESYSLKVLKIFL